MKKIILCTLLAGTAGLCAAQEMGNVISATPIVQQVGVPRQICNNETVVQQPRSSGGGALLGALVGGVLGHTVGGGNGKSLATMVGAFGGAVAGDQIEGRAPGYAQNVQHCSTQTYLENRTMGYTVVYEYAGRQYSTQTSYDPGPQIPVQVTPVGSAPMDNPQAAAYAPTYAPTYAAPAPVYAPSSPRPVYMQPSYPPVGVSVDLGYSTGPRHWR